MFPRAKKPKTNQTNTLPSNNNNNNNRQSTKQTNKDMDCLGDRPEQGAVLVIQSQGMCWIGCMWRLACRTSGQKEKHRWLLSWALGKEVISYIAVWPKEERGWKIVRD